MKKYLHVEKKVDITGVPMLLRETRSTPQSITWKTGEENWR
jgi:uncharacterized protein YcgL (UPF0745 family)